MLLLLAAFLILLNAFFVAAEFALVKVRTTQLDTLIGQGRARARLARSIVHNLDGYLSATQLGITLASLGLGYAAEEPMAELLGPLVALLGVHDPKTVHLIATTTGFVIISFLHIVVGEVAPKSLAIARPDTTALMVSPLMRAFYVMFWPFLWLLNASSNALLRLAGIESAHGGSHAMAVTPEELAHITAHSEAEGVLPADQSQLLTNVLNFSDHVVREIMVPRNRVVFIDAKLSVREALAYIVNSGHTRYPLIDGNQDNIVGVLHQKDLLPFLLENKEPTNLRAMARRVIYVPENFPAQKLMQEFQRQRSHFAIVVDEYGGLSGIVTMEDALEELVGEIQDEFDDQELQPIIKTDNGGYNVDGGFLLADLLEAIEMPEVEADADTVGGYVMEKLGRIPALGDTVVLYGWTLRVKGMEGMRIGRLDVLPPAPVIEK